MHKKILKFTIIFVVIFCWIFGYPPIYENFWRARIWENPPIPPKIQKAKADDTTKTYAFATDSENWAGTGGVDTTNSYQSGAGNPAGSIQSRILGRKKKDSAAGWYISGITWENLGVPAGATVNNVDGKYDWQCSEYTTGDSSASGNLTVTDSADGNSTTLETEVTFTATTEWATRNATGVVSMPSALQPSNTSIKIKLIGDLNAGNAAAAAVARQMDNVVLIITYTPAAVVSVSVSDGVVAYGTMATGTSKTTIDLTDTQTLTNDGNVTVAFNIKGQNTACPWTLAATAGTDQYVHQFCKKTDVSCTTPPTNYNELTADYVTLYTGVPVSETRQLDLRVIVPTVSSCFTSQAIDVTIQAMQ